MKKIFLPFLLLFISTNLYAQTSIVGSLGMGGGVIFGSLNPNMKDLNVELKTAYLKEFEGGIFGFGGGGGLTLGNIRFGGYGIGGGKEILTSIPGGNIISKLNYGYGVGYLGYEFLKIDDVRFSFDIGVGGGSIGIQMINKTQGTIDWSNIFFPATNNSKSLEMNFFYYQPSLVLEYIYGGFLKFFVAGDYSGVVNGDWKQDGEFELMNVPNMKFNGFSIRAGVYLGIFL